MRWASETRALGVILSLIGATLVRRRSTFPSFLVLYIYVIIYTVYLSMTMLSLCLHVLLCVKWTHFAVTVQHFPRFSLVFRLGPFLSAVVRC